MKRLFVQLIMLLMSAIMPVMAQTNLNISKILDGKHASDPSVTETMISGSHPSLRKKKISVLHTFRAPAEDFAERLAPLVLADGAASTGRNVQYRNGKLAYAFLILKPDSESRNGDNRYIYYTDLSALGKGTDVMAVYVEGKCDAENVKKLIFKL